MAFGASPRYLKRANPSPHLRFLRVSDSDNQTPDSGSGPSDIRPISIVEEMKRSYLDYAMSVIVARALPDARDGLKPVHRRILFSMNEAGHTTGTSRTSSPRASSAT